MKIKGKNLRGFKQVKKSAFYLQNHDFWEDFNQEDSSKKSSFYMTTVTYNRGQYLLKQLKKLGQDFSWVAMDKGGKYNIVVRCEHGSLQELMYSEKPTRNKFIKRGAIEKYFLS